MPEGRTGTTPQYWLFKTERDAWSWERQAAAGPEGAEWDGVRNGLAQKHMKAMRKGDLGFFYYSGKEKSIVGIVKVSGEAHPDSTDPERHWQCVDVAVAEPLARPVSLAAIKADPALRDMVLVRNSRLSVQPVTPEEWRHVCALGGVRPGGE